MAALGRLSVEPERCQLCGAPIRREVRKVDSPRGAMTQTVVLEGAGGFARVEHAGCCERNPFDPVISRGEAKRRAVVVIGTAA